MNTNGKVKFTVVVDYEIDPDKAAELLASQLPNAAIESWLCEHSPMPEAITSAYDNGHDHSHNATQLRTALGRYLSEKKIEERRMLNAPMNVAVPMEGGAA